MITMCVHTHVHIEKHPLVVLGPATPCGLHFLVDILMQFKLRLIHTLHGPVLQLSARTMTKNQLADWKFFRTKSCSQRRFGNFFFISQYFLLFHEVQISLINKHYLTWFCAPIGHFALTLAGKISTRTFALVVA